MVTGSVAGIVYGEPRLTNDVDIVLEITPNDISQLTEAFPPDEYYCPPEEVIRVEAARALRGHFNLIRNDSVFFASPVNREGAQKVGIMLEYSPILRHLSLQATVRVSWIERPGMMKKC